MLVTTLPLLTELECEVLRWILHDKTDPEIAGILEIRTATASMHVHTSSPN